MRPQLRISMPRPQSRTALAAFKPLGILNARQGRLDEAAVAYRQLLQVRFDDPDLHNELGIIYARQGRFEEATRATAKPCDSIQTRPMLDNNLGNTASVESSR